MSLARGDYSSLDPIETWEPRDQPGDHELRCQWDGPTYDAFWESYAGSYGRLHFYHLLCNLLV